MIIHYEGGYCRIMPMSIEEEVSLSYYCPYASPPRYKPPHKMKVNLRASYIEVVNCPDCGRRHIFNLGHPFQLIPSEIASTDGVCIQGDKKKEGTH